MKWYLLLFVLLCSFFFVPKQVHAVDIVVTESPSEIEDEFSAKININGAKAGVNYFCLVLKENDKNISMLSTWNGSEWYIGSSGKNCLSSSVTSKVEGLVIKGKLKEGVIPGSYLLSVKRYTQSGSYASGDNVQEVAVKVSVHTPQPTPTNDPTSIPTPQPDKTSLPTSTPKNTFIPLETVLPSVLAKEDIRAEASSVSSTTEAIRTKKSILPVALIGTGLLIMCLGGYVFWKEGGLVDIIKR